MRSRNLIYGCIDMGGCKTNWNWSTRGKRVKLVQHMRLSNNWYGPRHWLLGRMTGRVGKAWERRRHNNSAGGLTQRRKDAKTQGIWRLVCTLLQSSNGVS